MNRYYTLLLLQHLMFDVFKNLKLYNQNTLRIQQLIRMILVLNNSVYRLFLKPFFKALLYFYFVE